MTRSSVALRMWLLLLSACSTEAIVHVRSQGQPVEGVLVTSTPHAVEVDMDGQRALVPAVDIEEIDHPGNVAGTLGAILMAAGVSVTIPAIIFIRSDPCGVPFCMNPAVIGWMMLPFGVSGTLGGAITAAWGFSTWSDSRWAARAADP